MMAVFAWMVSYFWYAMVFNLNQQSPFTLSVKLFHSLNLNIAMGFGKQVMAQYEVQGQFVVDRTHNNHLFQLLAFIGIIYLHHQHPIKNLVRL